MMSESKIKEVVARGNTFRTLFGPDIEVVLQFTGLCSISSAITGKFYRPNFLEIFPLIVGVSSITTMLVCQYLSVYRYWTIDKNYVLNVFTISIETIVVLVKGIRLWSQRLELRELFGKLKDSWFELVNTSMMTSDCIKLAKRASSICKLYTVVSIFTFISYGTRPYVLISHYYIIARKKNVSYDFTQTIYGYHYPFAVTTMPKYLSCLAGEQIFLIFCMVYWISSDLIFTKLCTHVAIQFRVLSDDLEQIQVVLSVENDEKKVNQRLTAIAKRHHNLFQCCRQFNSIFDPILLISMLFTSVNVCICVFQLEKELSKPDYVEVGRLVPHLTMLLIQISLYCSYSESLTDQSSMIASAAYDCPWADQSQEFKIIILIIMARAQQQFTLTAYGMICVNVSKISQIANTAASYFMLLKTVA